MKMLFRLGALAVIFALASIAWLVFGGVMHARTSQQQGELVGRVYDLWGQPQVQQAPTLEFQWTTQESRVVALTDQDGNEIRDPQTGITLKKKILVDVPQTRAAALSSTRIAADMRLDQRRKGLLWFSLYDVTFEGTWTYVHDGPAGTLVIDYAFPDPNAVYDNFHFVVNGLDRAGDAVNKNGMVTVSVPMADKESTTFTVGYRSRGMDSWTYKPASAVGSQIEDFDLKLTTDFADIDFPAYTLSPSSKVREGDGWKLDWTFTRLVTGNGMGMVTPSRVQPGPLAADMSFSAPISLGLFMLWIFALGLLKKVDVHPVNHLFLAAAFFAFHLLFGYSADHLPVEWAFALSSAVSVLLVVSYLRLVVGSRFAYVEAGLAQLVYLVGFSLAHFWDGFTGLTVTVLGILTLFALMQLTGRIRWASVFGETEVKGSAS